MSSLPSLSSLPSRVARGVALTPWSTLRRHALRGLELALWTVALGWSLAFVVKYLRIAGATVDYPFHLEWMEGGTIESVARVLDGKPLYTEPSVEYVPYIYGPLYFWVTAAVASITGLDFLAARLVSLASILGCGALFYRWAWRETGAHVWGALAVGMLLATYDATGRWFHLARVDSLGLLLLFGGLYALRFAKTWRAALVAAVLLWLSILTKQNALAPVVGALTVACIFDRHRGWLAAATCVALTAASVLVLQQVSDGWFLYYVLEVGRQHERLASMLRGFWAWDLGRMGVPMALSLVAVALTLGRSARDGLFDLAALSGLLVMSWFARIHSGGYLNVLMPAFAGLSLWLALGLGALDRRFGPAERERFGGSLTAMGLALAVIFQCAALEYEQAETLPAPGSVEGGERYVEAVAGLEGEVLVADQRWVQTRAGKTSYGLGMAARDLLRMQTADDPGRQQLMRSLEQAFAEKRFAAVILSERHPWHGMRPHYRFAYALEGAPEPVTGWRIRPQFVWLPAESVETIAPPPVRRPGPRVPIRRLARPPG